MIMPTEVLPSELAKMLKDVQRDLQEMRTSLERDFRKENRELKASIQAFTEKFETMNTRYLELQEENLELKKANASLVGDCAELKKQVRDQEQRIVELEQYSRNRNIEIKGVPASEGEDLPGILDKIAKAVGEPITSADVAVCHRVPCKEPSRSNIIVQFHNRTKRDVLLAKARKARLSVEDLGMSEKGPVFINEHLCPALKKLLGMTVAKKKDKGWRFAWSRDGKIFARKTESSRILRVSCVTDLDKME